MKYELRSFNLGGDFYPKINVQFTMNNVQFENYHPLASRTWHADFTDAKSMYNLQCTNLKL